MGETWGRISELGPREENHLEGNEGVKVPGMLQRLRRLRRATLTGALAGAAAVILGIYLSPYLLAAGYRIVLNRRAPAEILENYAAFMGGPGNILFLGVVVAVLWGVADRRNAGFRLTGSLVCGLTAAWVVLAVIQVRWYPVLWWELVFYQVSGIAGGVLGGGVARGLSRVLRAELRAVSAAQRAAADARDADSVARALGVHLGANHLAGIALFLGEDEDEAGRWSAPGRHFDPDQLLGLAPALEGFEEEGAAVVRVSGVKGMRFALFVPLGDAGGAHGVLVAGFTGRRTPGPRTRRRFALSAPVAALALEVRRKERHLATIEGQRRLARRMHDGHKQDLLSVPRHLHLAKQRLETGDRKAALESIGFAREGALRAVREADALVRELRYEGRRGAGLPQMLEQLGQRVMREEDLVVEVVVRGEARDIGFRTENELFWVARAALGNTVRHARATRCILKLVYADGMVAVEIRDDGVGFDPGTAKLEDGYGLASMRERTREVGGVLLVQSSSGSGTSILASVPTPGEASGR